MTLDDKKALMKLVEDVTNEAVTDSADLLKQIGIRPEAYARVVLNAINTTPAVLKCSAGTIRRAILKCAQLGLMPDGDQAAIVPYKGKAQLIVGYKGKLDLAREAIPGISIVVNAVTKDDLWEYEEGMKPILRHIPAEEGEYCTEKNFRACYILAWMPGNNQPERVVLYKKEIDYIRRTYSHSSSESWIKEYAEQAKKTAINRMGKRLPIRSGLLKNKGIDIGDDAFRDQPLGGDDDEPKNVTPKKEEKAKARQPRSEKQESSSKEQEPVNVQAEEVPAGQGPEQQGTYRQDDEEVGF